MSYFNYRNGELFCEDVKISDVISLEVCVDFTMFENGTYLVDYTQRRTVAIQDGANVHYVDYKTVDIVKY